MLEYAFEETACGGGGGGAGPSGGSGDPALRRPET